MPIVTALLFVAFLIPSSYNDTMSPIYALRQPGSDLVPTVPTFLMTFYPFAAALTAIYGWVIGCGAKKMDIKRDGRAFHLFFGSRPMSDENLVWTKMKVAAVSTGVAWGVFILASCFLLFAPGGQYQLSTGTSFGNTAPLYKVLLPSLNLDALVRITLILSMIVFLTWRNYVIGLWAELSGNLAFRYAQPMIAVALAVTLGNTNMDRPEKLPYIIGGLAVWIGAKLAFALYLGFQQWRSGLVLPASLVKVGLGYLTAVAFFEGVVFYLLAPAFNQTQWSASLETMFKATVALLVLAFVPIVRILLPVSTLSANRHR